MGGHPHVDGSSSSQESDSNSDVGLENSMGTGMVLKSPQGPWGPKLFQGRVLINLRGQHTAKYFINRISRQAVNLLSEMLRPEVLQISFSDL